MGREATSRRRHSITLDGNAQCSLDKFSTNFTATSVTRRVPNEKNRCSIKLVVLPPFRDGAPIVCPVDLCDLVPKNIFTEREATIGGIGKTLRWSFQTGAFKDKEEIEICFSNIEDTHVFLALMETLDRTVVSFQGLCMVDRVTHASLLVFRPWLCINIASYVCSFTKCDYEISDQTRACTFDIGLERMDREDFTFWNQIKTTAAPKQGWYKWEFSWLDKSWTQLPFTWQRLARNMDRRSLVDCPVPLRYHVAALRAADVRARSVINSEDADVVIESPLQAGEEISRKYFRNAHLPSTRVVTGALSSAQTRQLLGAQYVMRYWSHDEAAITSATQVLRAYVEHGYTSKLYGPYEQCALFVGHGKSARPFKK